MHRYLYSKTPSLWKTKGFVVCLFICFALFLKCSSLWNSSVNYIEEDLVSFLGKKRVEHGHLFSLPCAQQAWPLRNYQSMVQRNCQSLERNVTIGFWPHLFPSALWWLLLRYLLPDCSFCSWDISRFSTRKKVVNVNWAGEVKLYCKVTGFYPGFQWTIGEFVLSSLFTWRISMIMKQYYHPAKWKLLNKRWGSYGGKIKYGWNNIYWSYHQLCRLASRFGGW